MWYIQSLLKLNDTLQFEGQTVISVINSCALYSFFFISFCPSCSIYNSLSETDLTLKAEAKGRAFTAARAASEISGAPGWAGETAPVPPHEPASPPVDRGATARAGSGWRTPVTSGVAVGGWRATAVMVASAVGWRLRRRAERAGASPVMTRRRMVSVTAAWMGAGAGARSRAWGRATVGGRAPRWAPWPAGGAAPPAAGVRAAAAAAAGARGAATAWSLLIKDELHTLTETPSAGLLVHDPTFIHKASDVTHELAVKSNQEML